MENLVPKQIGDYIFSNSLLGKGGFAHVRAAKHICSNIVVAVKIIPKTTINSMEMKNQLRREVDALSFCDHPFIAKFYDFLEDLNFYYIIQELVPQGNLLDSVNARGHISEDQCRHYFVQLLSAVDYLHNKLHITHRDLKAENVLLDLTDNIRLVDFGLCRLLNNENEMMNTACGSLAYAAPEMMQGHKYSQSADIWSLGVLLYAIANCKLPWEDDNCRRLMQKIIYTDPNYSMSLSPTLIDLLQKMMEKDPYKRITLEEIRNHPWISGYLTGNRKGWLDSLVKPNHIFDQVDTEILSELEKLGFSKEETKKELDEDLRTKGTITYQIIRRQKLANRMCEMTSNQENEQNYIRCTVTQTSIINVKRNEAIKNQALLHRSTLVSGDAINARMANRGCTILNITKNCLKGVNVRSNYQKKTMF